MSLDAVHDDLRSLGVWQRGRAREDLDGEASTQKALCEVERVIADAARPRMEVRGHDREARLGQA